jgi:hypothetical protein
MREMSVATRSVVFGVLCLVLAVVAAIAAAWVPLVILALLGAAFVGRGVMLGRP